MQVLIAVDLILSFGPDQITHKGVVYEDSPSS